MSDAEDDALERRVRDALGEAADCELIPCDPAAADTAAFCERYGFAPEDSANTILVATKKEPVAMVACVVLATTKLSVNQTVRKRLDRGRLSFATADQTVAMTGMRIGGVTPFGLPADLPLWIDRAVMERPRVIVGGGSRRVKLLVPPSRIAARPGAEVVDGLAMPIAHEA